MQSLDVYVEEAIKNEESNIDVTELSLAAELSNVTECNEINQTAEQEELNRLSGKVSETMSQQSVVPAVQSATPKYKRTVTKKYGSGFLDSTRTTNILLAVVVLLLFVLVCKISKGE